MAAYPITTAHPGSTKRQSQKAEAFVDGAGGSRVYWPAQKNIFSLKHKLTIAARNTLMTFFATNKLLTSTFNWTEDGGLTYTTYNVVFLERPVDEDIPDFPSHRMVSVELGEA